MIGRSFAQGSFGRRILTRAVLAGGAMWLGGHLMRSMPHDQTLVFPVGSVFPNATRFSASWKRVGASEPSGGVTLAFNRAPPLQIRQHASLPNGDYVVTLNITETAQSSEPTLAHREAGDGVQTNIERRVTLSGGEAQIALAAGGF